MSRALALQADSRFDTQFGWGATQNRIVTPLTAYQEAEASFVGINTLTQTGNITDYNITGRRLLTNGIILTPSVDLNRNADNLIALPGANTSRVQFQVVLPLLRNRGRDVVTAQQRSAALGVDASALDLSQAAAVLISNVTTAYWNYVATLGTLEVLKGSEERGRVLVSDVQLLINADRLARAEIYNVNANFVERTTNRIAGEQQVIVARQSLAVAMGLSAEQITAVGLPSDGFPASESVPPTNPEALRSYIEQALGRRADYLAARRREQAAEPLVTLARNQLKPQLDASFSAGYAGLHEGRTPDGFFSSTITGVRGLNLVGGLTYSFPVQNRLAQGQLAQASANKTIAQLQYEDLGRNIASNVVVAATGVANALLQLKQAHESVISFQQALAGEQDKLRLGVGNLVDILTIEERLTGALITEVNAQLTYATSIIQFRFATGTIMEPGAMVQTVSRDVLVTTPAPGGPAQKEQNR